MSVSSRRISLTCRICQLLLLSVAIGVIYVSPPVTQYQVITEIRRSGGYVSTSRNGLSGSQRLLSEWVPDAFAEIDAVQLADVRLKPAWMRAISRSDNLRLLWLNRSGVTDEDLMHMAGNRTLRELYLNGNPITDQGLKNLGHLPSLERLQLNHTSVENPASIAGSMPAVWMLKLRGTDVGVAAVGEIAAQMPSLREIDLSNTRVTDLAIENLCAMVELESVQLEGSRTSEAGAVHLHTALQPNCTVFTAGGSCLIASRYR